MNLKQRIKHLESLGYEVGLSAEIPTPERVVRSYYIDGHGVQTYLRDDDQDGWDSMADKDAHDERVKQIKEAVENGS
jgi:hypothetical protein